MNIVKVTPNMFVISFLKFLIRFLTGLLAPNTVLQRLPRRKHGSVGSTGTRDIVFQILCVSVPLLLYFLFVLGWGVSTLNRVKLLSAAMDGQA